MEPYARAYLQFLTCAAGSGPNAEAFVFATRLTRLTRALASRNPERAIQRAAAAAPDWSSGTRIGDALKAFNDRHGRRGMARGAVIVILSDGWERGDPELVGREMERLARLAHRIVWVNPRVAASGFSPRAGGMAAALPHCDALVSGHSLGRSRRSRRRSAARATGPSRSPGARARGRSLGERDAGAGQLGGDAQRLRAEPRQDDAGVGIEWTLMTSRQDAASTPAASARRCPRTRWAGLSPLLRPGGAQRVDRTSGAPAADGGRDQTKTRRSDVADEAYRAVFLRVHPTGKMVLSLTTEADGKEAEYAQLVATELGVPALDVKVVPADRPLRRVTASTRPVAGHRGGGPQRRGQDPRQGAAARRRGAGRAGRQPRWDNGAFFDAGRPRACRRSPTSPCTPTAAACCPPASRAASTPRPSTATS